MKKLIAAAFGSLAIAAAPATAANLLVNGSFETPSGQGFASLPPGSTAMDGWTTIGNSGVAWLPAAYSVNPQDGLSYLDLMGFQDQAGAYGGVQQSIATQVGASYALSFWLGRHPDDAGTIGLVASAGGASQSFTATSSAGAWTRYSMAFTATGSSTLISLTGNQGTYHIGLDNVSVEQATPGVPEPASWALLLAGFGAIGVATRRQAKAAMTRFAGGYAALVDSPTPRS